MSLQIDHAHVVEGVAQTVDVEDVTAVLRPLEEAVAETQRVATRLRLHTLRAVLPSALRQVSPPTQAQVVQLHLLARTAKEVSRRLMRTTKVVQMLRTNPRKVLLYRRIIEGSVVAIHQMGGLCGRLLELSEEFGETCGNVFVMELGSVGAVSQVYRLN